MNYLRIQCLLACVLLMSIQIVSAQNYVDLASIYYSNSASSQYEKSTESTTIQEFGGNATAPLKLKNGNAILAGISYEQFVVKLGAGTDPASVSTAGLKLGTNVNHSEKLNASYLIMPKMASDFTKQTSKNFQIGAVALYKYKTSEQFKYKFGMYYNSELSGTMLFPLLGCYYKSANDKLEVNITLPVAADVNYELKQWLAIGVDFSGLSSTYYLGPDANETKGYYLTKASNELFGYLQFHVTKNILLTTKAGYSKGRSYRVYNEDDRYDFAIASLEFGDNRKQLNEDFEDGFIAEILLRYRFQLDQ